MLILFNASNFCMSFRPTGKSIPDMLSSCSYFTYFSTRFALSRQCTECNAARIDHKKHLLSVFLMFNIARFGMSSWGVGIYDLGCAGLYLYTFNSQKSVHTYCHPLPSL